MIEAGLVKKEFVGRDGFVWWVGQIAPQSTWVQNAPDTNINSVQEERGFGQRYKVRIMGYHTATKTDLPDEQLPWATVMYPPTAGGGGRNCTQTANLSQGTFVFGFFLDGEDAQQPVIMGCIGYNDYTEVIQNLPMEGSNAAFMPWSGYVPGDMIPQGGLTTPQSPAQRNESVQVALSLKSKLNTDSTGACSPDRVPKPLATPSANSKSKLPISNVQKKVQNAITQIQKLQKQIYNTSCGAHKDLNKIAKQINEVITEATKDIAADLKSIYKNISKDVMDALNKVAKKILSWIPTQYRIAAEEFVLLSTDNIACLFKRLIATLLGTIRDFIVDAVQRVINVADCFVNQFVANFLGTVRSAIAGIIGALQSKIAELADALMGPLDIVEDVLGIVDNILSFLTCNVRPKENTIEAWSVLHGESLNRGTPVTASDIDNILSQANSLGDTFSRVGDFSDIENAIDGVDFSGIFDNTQCDTSAILCGPPILQFLGSTGAGARANLIIGTLGEVIGVDILSFGDGNYSNDTRAIISDPCGNGLSANFEIRFPTGRGGRGTIVEFDGTGTTGEFEVIVTDPGTDYLPSPNGSRGAGGETWSQPDDTVIYHPDGTFDPPVPPGWDVEVSPGDTINLPPGTCVTLEPSGEELCGGPVDVKEGGKFTTPHANYDSLRGSYPSDDGAYPVILSLCEIIIIKGGAEYQQGDEIVIEPNAGAKAVPQFDRFGGVVGVRIIDPGEGFKTFPKVYIKSETGYNVELLPKFCIDRVSDEKIQEVGREKVLSVIDCVGNVGESRRVSL